MNFEDEVRNCHGQMAMPMTAQMYEPRRIVRNLGSNAVRSVPAEMELAAMLVPSWARTKQAEMRNVPARSPAEPTPFSTPPLVMKSFMRSSGFHDGP